MMADKPLKETIEWISTMAERRDLAKITEEEACVMARRSLDDDPRQLPKTVARESVEEAVERNT